MEMAILKNIIKDSNNADCYKEEILYKNKRINIKKSMMLIKLRNLIRIINPLYFELPHIGIRITPYCSLKCKYCADLIPYQKNPCLPNLTDIKKDIYTILTSVDYVHEFLIIGGETFLRNDLPEIINYCLLFKNIGYITLTTNGTIMPKDKLIKALKNDKIIVRVSNYGRDIVPNRNKIISEMLKNGIIVDRLEYQKWGYLGNFKKRNRTKRQLQQIYKSCSMKFCRTAIDGTVYICGRQNGEDANLIPKIKKNEKYTFRSKSRNDIRMNLRKLYALEYISTCDYCDGLSTKTKLIKPGEQLK